MELASLSDAGASSGTLTVSGRWMMEWAGVSSVRLALAGNAGYSLFTVAAAWIPGSSISTYCRAMHSLMLLIPPSHATSVGFTAPETGCLMTRSGIRQSRSSVASVAVADALVAA